MDPDATSIGSVALGFGFGARVSLFEGGPLPGVSVTGMRRSIPRLQYGSLGAGDDYSFSAAVTAGNLGAAIGQTFSALAVEVVLGQDWYEGDASVRFRDPLGGATGVVNVDLSTTRTLVFGNVGLDFGYIRVVGEAGYQFGKDQGITTVFQDFDPASGRFFAAAGLQFGL